MLITLEGFKSVLIDLLWGFVHSLRSCGVLRTFRGTLLTYLGSVWSDSLLRREFRAHVPRGPTQETCEGELFPLGVIFCCFAASSVVVLGCFGFGA